MCLFTDKPDVVTDSSHDCFSKRKFHNIGQCGLIWITALIGRFRSLKREGAGVHFRCTFSELFII